MSGLWQVNGKNSTTFKQQIRYDIQYRITSYNVCYTKLLRYRIGSEDVLHVSVWGNEELTMDVIVRPDGKISIPLVQDIQAEGFTASELSDQIHQKLLPYIKDPNVSVIVKQINAPKFSVIGYVNRPGTYPMRRNNFV